MVCVGKEGYPYTRHLEILDSRKPRGPPELPDTLRSIATPLDIQEWTRWLAAYPDAGYRDYILRGLMAGFRIGFRYGRSKSTPALSATQNTGVVDEYLQKEVKLGRVIGPMVREGLK